MRDVSEVRVTSRVPYVNESHHEHHASKILPVRKGDFLFSRANTLETDRGMLSCHEARSQAPSER